MIKSGKGGGNTRTGLIFEGKTDLSTFLNNQPHYNVNGHDVFFDGEKVAEVYKKHSFYKVFLTRLQIDWKQYISKQLLPDDSIFVLLNNKLFIVECKHQEWRANIDVEYIYLLDNWFRDPRYKDVLNYIQSVGCDYYFEYIPLTRLGLPVPPELIND